MILQFPLSIRWDTQEEMLRFIEAYGSHAVWERTYAAVLAALISSNRDRRSDFEWCRATAAKEADTAVEIFNKRSPS